MGNYSNLELLTKKVDPSQNLYFLSRLSQGHYCRTCCFSPSHFHIFLSTSDCRCCHGHHSLHPLRDFTTSFVSMCHGFFVYWFIHDTHFLSWATCKEQKIDYIFRKNHYEWFCPLWNHTLRSPKIAPSIPRHYRRLLVIYVCPICKDWFFYEEVYG